ALELMRPVLDDMHRLGGSHAQQDVLNQLFLDAAVKAERADDVRLILARVADQHGAPQTQRVGYADAARLVLSSANGGCPRRNLGASARLPQISTSLVGSSSRLSAPGGKCSANTVPHCSIAATKPSPGRPCFIPAISAPIAASHTCGVTLALMPASATI